MLTTFYQTGPNGLFIFYQVFNLILQSAKKYALSLFKKFDNTQNSIYHLEVFSNGHNVILCEVGSRLGGGRILQEIEKEFTFSPIKELLKIELGIHSFFEQKRELRLKKSEDLYYQVQAKEN